MLRIRLATLLTVLALLAAAGLLLAVPAARAQGGAAPSASYSLTWYTVDGGGATSTGAGYRLTGTAGQPDAGALSHGAYTLAGGFWSSVTALVNQLNQLFVPLIQR